MHRMILGTKPAACVFQSSDIERLTNSLGRENIRAQQLIRGFVRDDSSVIDNDDAVNIPVQNVLQTMLDDQNREILLLHDLINERNGLLAGRRIQVGEGFIEKKNVHIVDHDTAHGNPLLLSSGKLARGVVQKCLQIQLIGDSIYLFMNFILCDGIVLQRKGKVLRYSKTDELPVRILQNSADLFGHAENAGLGRIQPADAEGPGDIAGK